MYQLGKTGIKVLKTAHCMVVGCWLGGAAALITLNISNPVAQTEGMLLGINTAANLIDLWVVVAIGAMGCLLTGLLYSLLTPWGFFKHKWLALKWLIYILCILSGTFLLGEWEGAMVEMSRIQGNAALNDAAYISTKTWHLAFSVVQVLAMTLMIALSIFKPWGRKSQKPQ